MHKDRHTDRKTDRDNQQKKKKKKKKRKEKRNRETDRDWERERVRVTNRATNDNNSLQQKIPKEQAVVNVNAVVRTWQITLQSGFVMCPFLFLRPPPSTST